MKTEVYKQLQVYADAITRQELNSIQEGSHQNDCLPMSVRVFAKYAHNEGEKLLRLKEPDYERLISKNQGNSGYTELLGVWNWTKTRGLVSSMGSRLYWGLHSKETNS